MGELHFGDIFHGEANVHLGLFSTDFKNLNLRGVQAGYALITLHELIHLAGGGASTHDGSRAFYSDLVLAEAARILYDPGAPQVYDPNMPITQITGDMVSAAGDYWDSQLLEHCTPQEYK